MVLREEPACRSCGDPASEVDHIDGDVTNNRRDNLQPLCGTCHKKKTYREQGALGNVPKS